MSNVTYVTEWMNKQTKPNHHHHNHSLLPAPLLFRVRQ